MVLPPFKYHGPPLQPAYLSMKFVVQHIPEHLNYPHSAGNYSIPWYRLPKVVPVSHKSCDVDLQ